jgi:hypothetical protein
MRRTAGIVSASILLVISVASVRIQSQSPTGTMLASRHLLTQAIWNGGLATVKRLLASGADPLKKDEEGPPPFLAPWELALVAGNNDALQLLLEKVSTLPKGDDRCDRRLATAAGMNNVVATRELLRRGFQSTSTISGEVKSPTVPWLVHTRAVPQNPYFERRISTRPIPGHLLRRIVLGNDGTVLRGRRLKRQGTDIPFGQGYETARH